MSQGKPFTHSGLGQLQRGHSTSSIERVTRIDSPTAEWIYECVSQHIHWGLDAVTGQVHCYLDIKDQRVTQKKSPASVLNGEMRIVFEPDVWGRENKAWTGLLTSLVLS